MKHSLFPLLAAATFAAAAPAQALDQRQVDCVVDSIPAEIQLGVTEEYGTADGWGSGYDAFVEQARACAEATGVTAEQRDDYVNYGIFISIAGIRRAQLEMNEYRTDLFDSGLEALLANVEDPFLSATGLTEDAVEFMSDFFDKSDEDFIPMEDEDQRALFQMVQAYGMLLSLTERLQSQ